MTGMSFDAAHNEWLQYLITIGVLGTIFYIALCGLVLLRSVKNMGKQKELLIYIVPIVAYLANSTINIAQLMSTPFLFVLLAIAESYNRKLSVIDTVNL